MRLLYLTILLLCLVACNDSFAPIDFNNDIDLPEEYMYELRINCFCFVSYVGPHRMHIKGNQIVDYELLADGEAPDEEQIQRFTIEALVENVNDFIERDPVIENITLHPIYNFPTDVYFDVDEGIADEEWGFTISKFEVIN